MVTHTFQSDALGELDAVSLAEAIRTRRVSAAEVMQAVAARAQAAASLGAVVSERFAEALEEPHEPTGPFGGVPTFVKDLGDVAGLPTRYGSAAYEKAAPARRHDRFVEKLVALGFRPVGKSALPEFGFSCSSEPTHRPPTRNPWNPEYSTGGSSSGAGALVAAGVVPLAHAADGGGSTRIPAACCGLVGLKPTAGRLPPSKMLVNQPVRIAVDGVITRTVHDTHAFYAALEQVYRPRRMPSIGAELRPLARPLRVAVYRTAPIGAGLDAVMTRELDRTITLVESLGHEVREIDTPGTQAEIDAFRRYWFFGAYMTRAVSGRQLDRVFERGRLDPFTNGLADAFRGGWLGVPSALYTLGRLRRRARAFFEDIDVLLTPTVNHLTPRLGYLDLTQDFETVFPRVRDWAGFTPFANATGGPSISLPLGHDEPTGLPVGMLFTASHGEDRLLLELALQLERAQPFRRLQDAGRDGVVRRDGSGKDVN